MPTIRTNNDVRPTSQVTGVQPLVRSLELTATLVGNVKVSVMIEAARTLSPR